MRDTMRIFAALLSVAGAGCTSEDDAIKFAYNCDRHIVRGRSMPDDPQESYELAFEILQELGWTTRIKEPGGEGQPPNSDRAAAVDARGPKIVWLPVNWAYLSDITRARMAWHELAHVQEQIYLGRDEMAHRLSTEPYWRVAMEIPASAQSLVVLARYGVGEDELHRRVDVMIDNYPKRMELDELEDAETWYGLGRTILHAEVVRMGKGALKEEGEER